MAGEGAAWQCPDGKMKAMFSSIEIRRLPQLALAAAFIFCSTPLRGNESPAAETPVGLDRAASDAKFATDLETLAAKCDELGLQDEAATTRGWIVPRNGRRRYLFVPTAKDTAQPASGASERTKQWYAKFREIRQTHAGELYKLASANVEAHPAAAYQLLHEVLRDDPDHAEARRALGYTLGPSKEWLPKTGTWRAEPGKIDHPRFGWRRGQYWRVDTPHYQILSDQSAKAALELAAELENLVVLWKQTFFDFWGDSTWLKQRMAGQPAKPPLAAKMQVVLFKDRDEYLRILGPSQPQIELSLGIYIDHSKKVYLYAADPAPRSTWIHEAAHQLFQELPAHQDGAGEEANFWFIEGAAVYMESLSEHDGYWTVGGWEADRLQAARYRALSGDYLLSLGKLALLGRRHLQQDGDIRKMYSQAGGLAHFLFDGMNGQYRRQANDYLRSVYQHTDLPISLARHTKTSLAELEKQYLQFLQVTDNDLANTPDLEQVTQLSLGRTAVTDEGMRFLAPCQKLKWLDLSLAPVSDDGLKHLAAATSLEQLFLEGTKITDTSMPMIGKFKQLEELDLTRLAISNEGLTHLSGLKKLKTLHLGGTPITDAGLRTILKLPSLQSVDLTGTGVSSDEVLVLKQNRPKLQIEGF
jgi:hypothetical protein